MTAAAAPVIPAHVITFPPTILVVHPKERRSKCTVEPLRGRPDFVFWNYPHPDARVPAGYVRLGLGGPELTHADARCGLLLLDGTWRLTAAMERSFSHLPVRSLSGWHTAYPRVSKLFDDPPQGLATIEALFAAYCILGRDTAGLLDAYRFRDEFLERNARRMQS